MIVSTRTYRLDVADRDAVLQAMGVNAAMIMDFHGDGHPRDGGETRLRELGAFYDSCRKQSGPDFLLIPAEEANVHFGGHWALAFPKPVFWHMDRTSAQPGTLGRSASRTDCSLESYGVISPAHPLASAPAAARAIAALANHFMTVSMCAFTGSLRRR